MEKVIQDRGGKRNIFFLEYSVRPEFLEGDLGSYRFLNMSEPNRANVASVRLILAQPEVLRTVRAARATFAGRVKTLLLEVQYIPKTYIASY